MQLPLASSTWRRLGSWNCRRPSEYESLLASRQILRRDPRRTRRARAMSRNVAVFALCKQGVVVVSRRMRSGRSPAADNHPMTSHKVAGAAETSWL